MIVNRARIAGVVYLLVFVTGATALLARGSLRSASGVAAGVLYVVVTLLFYQLFRPVNQPVALAATMVSLLGIAIGPLLKVNPLPLFGLYCLMVGYLIVRSAFVPKVLGVLMAIGGLGWLTFASPSLAAQLTPYNFAPGMVGEGALTLWLLLFGVDGPQPSRAADAHIQVQSDIR